MLKSYLDFEQPIADLEQQVLDLKDSELDEESIQKEVIRLNESIMKNNRKDLFELNPLAECSSCPTSRETTLSRLH